jgi:hypothetical protein
MTDPHQDTPPCSAAVLAAAAATVILGTLLVDYTRAWLLVIPVSFLLAAFAAGTLLRHFAAGSSAMDQPATSHLAVRIGTGVAVLSLCATWSALAGVLWVAGIATLLCVAAGIALAVRIFQPNRPTNVLIPIVSGLVLGVVWLIAWLWATTPPVFYDELAYHLVIPERALATGSLPAYPWVWFTLMPYASDLLLAWGMAIGGELGARAMHWSFWVWGSLAAWGLLDALRRPQSSDWTAALVAGALASSPTFWFLGTLTFAETCLAAALVTAACVLATSEQHRRPWLPAGLLFGLAATVKLSGPAWVLAGLAAGLVLRWSMRNLALSALISLACLVPWWGRASRMTGNPVYPLAYEWLGGGGLWDDTNQALLKGDLPPGASDLGLAGVLRLPWDLVAHPERFGSASDAGLLAVTATAVVLCFPVLTRPAHAGPRMKQLGDAASAFVLLAGAAWAATTTTTRFFAPALLLSLVAVLGATLSFRETGAAVALAAVIPLGVWGTARFLDQHETVFSSMRVALGGEQRDRYLARQLDHYEAATFVKTQVAADARLLFIGEARPYYFSREAVAPYPFDRHPLSGWVRDAGSPEALARRLAREKITHVVLNIREFRRLHDKYGVLKFTGARADEFDDRLRQLPRALRRLFAQNRVYVFEVPSAE